MTTTGAPGPAVPHPAVPHPAVPHPAVPHPAVPHPAVPHAAAPAAAPTSAPDSAVVVPAPPGVPPATARTRLRTASRLALAAAVVLALALASLFVGVSDVTPASLLGPGREDALGVLAVSRVPRTVALVLAGAATAVAGMLMQMLARNRFVEPSTAGTVESASLGLLAVTVLAPGAPLVAKMGVAMVAALAGTAVFLRILRAVPLRSVLVVPLVGLVLGGVIGAVTTFVALRLDLLQSLASWTTGDFSGVLRGRYELLWVAAALTVVAYLAADRFTVAGLGPDVTTGLGLSHRRVMTLGLVIVSMVTAVVVVTVGIVPFLGLVVPNIVSTTVGDHLRRAVPWVAVLGAGSVLACDLVGRLVRYPYEVPTGVVVGVVGSALFLHLLLRGPARVA